MHVSDNSSGVGKRILEFVESTSLRGKRVGVVMVVPRAEG